VVACFFLRFFFDTILCIVSIQKTCTGSASSEKEAEITTALAQNARETYFLCDSSKLEKDRYLPFAPINFVQNLITDSLAPKTLMKQYQASGVRVFK
jgi:DeoR family transcriptional regulator, fructose operon transcriptional repressor